MSKISHDALSVIRQLQKNGYKAYLVGGCVRDLLIGRDPKDFDVVTNAVPTAIKRIFRKARIIGRRFKIVHIPFGAEIIETATFRALPEGSDAAGSDDLLLKRDNKYGNEREDAIRRDFTINALFYDPVQGGILDYVGGYDDIQQGIIRIIGNASVSYREDPVRMIRAVKFQATTGFKMEKSTRNEISPHSSQILKCSIARVIEEIYKIMRSGSSLQTFRNLTQTKLIKFLLPKVYEMLHKASPDKLETTPLGKRLAVLDDLIKRGRKFNNVLFLIVIFYDLIQSQVANSDHPDIGYITNTYLTEISRNMGFSNRDKDMMVKATVVQRRFLDPEKKTRKFVRLFVFRDYFKDSLDFFEINCRTTSTGSDEILFWVKEYKKNLTRIRQIRQEKKAARRESNRRSRRRRSAGSAVGKKK